MALRTLALSSLAFVPAAASGQTFNSFKQAEALTGLSVAPLSPLEYRVDLAPGAVLIMDSQEIPITDVFGFWALSEDDNLEGSTSDFGVWSAQGSNAGTGGILGWKTNPNTGITAGNNVTFTFDELSTERVEFFGFHVRVDGTFPGTSGNTGFVYVPAPGSLAGLLVGTLIAFRRRR